MKYCRSHLLKSLNISRFTIMIKNMNTLFNSHWEFLKLWDLCRMKLSVKSKSSVEKTWFVSHFKIAVDNELWHFFLIWLIFCVLSLSLSIWFFCACKLTVPQDGKKDRFLWHSYYDKYYVKTKINISVMSMTSKRFMNFQMTTFHSIVY